MYNAALFVGSPIADWYADRTPSRRFPLLLGLVALSASTVLLCLGRTIALLVLGRALQGLSAAIVWSVGLALLVDTVGRDIGYAMGYVNIAMSAGLLISPAIGGAVYAAAGYYAVYYVAFARRRLRYRSSSGFDREKGRPSVARGRRARRPRCDDRTRCAY